MRRPITRALATMVLVAACASAARADDRPAVEGLYQGQLMTLHIVFHLDRATDGNLKLAIDSPDQGAMGIPADFVRQVGDSLTVTFSSIRAAYAGRFDGRRDTLDGYWSQGTTAMRLLMVRTSKAYEAQRPQNPVPPLPYDADTVRFRSAAKGVWLGGTFTHPRGEGPFPAVVLISGSGPQDRDEQIAGHKPFLVIADHLSRQGIAVLRYDDRGVFGSSGDYLKAITLDFADDAAGAVAWLRGRKDVDATHIGLAGHSEGGLIAPLVAAKDPKIAFLVLLAGTAVPGDSVLVTQSAAIIRALGGDSTAIENNHNAQNRMFGPMKSRLPQAAVARELEAIIRDRWAAVPQNQRPDSIQLVKMVRNEAEMNASPWMRAFLTLDPRVPLVKVKCPVLAINGTLDLQVLPEVNLPAMESALAAGGNHDVTVKRMEGLNHLFQTATTGLMGEYGQIQETISPKALSYVSDWIRSKTGLGAIK